MPKHAAEAPEFIIPQLVPDDEPVIPVTSYESTNVGVLGFGARAAEAPKPRPEASTVYRSRNARTEELAHFEELAARAERAREEGRAEYALGRQAVEQVLPPAPRPAEQAMPAWQPPRSFYGDQSEQ